MNILCGAAAHSIILYMDYGRGNELKLLHQIHLYEFNDSSVNIRWWLWSIFVCNAHHNWSHWSIAGKKKQIIKCKV